MHELSLAENIVNIGVAEARKHQSAGVQTVKVNLGEFAGVVREALEFGFEIARQGTLAEGAVLVIETVPIETRCPHCRLRGRPRVGDICLICPECGVAVELISGREIEVEYVELEGPYRESPMPPAPRPQVRLRR